MPGIQICPQAVRSSTACILAVDIGAFNIRYAVVDQGRVHRIYRFLTTPEGPTSPLDALLDQLKEQILFWRPDIVVIDAAGPVTPSGVKFTNVGLDIDLAAIREFVHGLRPRAQVMIVNDALSGAAGLLMLPPERFIRFNGPDQPLASYDEIIAVLLGSGMGVARILGDRVVSSELGHLWTRRGLAQIAGGSERLDIWFDKKFGGAPDAEDYVSGIGIVNIARGLIATRSGAQSERSAALLDRVPAHDQAKFIARRAQSPGGERLFDDTMHLFRESLGYALSSLGMLLAPVVLAGNPFSANIEYLFLPPLRHAMLRRHSHIELVREMPVYGLRRTNDECQNEINLIGAGAIGAMALSS